MEVIEGQSHHPNSSLDSLSSQTKWVTGITMVLRRSHLGDEKGRTLAGTTRANCRRALGRGRDPALHFPLHYRP